MIELVHIHFRLQTQPLNSNIFWGKPLKGAPNAPIKHCTMAILSIRKIVKRNVLAINQMNRRAVKGKPMIHQPPSKLIYLLQLQFYNYCPQAGRIF